MARPLLPAAGLHVRNLSLPFTTLFAFVAVFSLISTLTFLCASHRRTRSRKETMRRSRIGMSTGTTVSDKALLLVKMISWKKLQVEEEEEEYDGDGVGTDHEEGEDEAIWRKTIMMGERCRPIDFSGSIVYDAQGNLLPDQPNRARLQTMLSLDKP